MIKPVVITAGQYNSGSTALYNLVRLLIEEKYQKDNIHYGHFSRRNHKDLGIKKDPLDLDVCPIIKCHEKPKDHHLEKLGFMNGRESHLYMSYRSLRQVAAGMIFKSKIMPKLRHSKMKQVIKQNIDIFKVWTSIEEEKLSTKRIIKFNEILNDKEMIVNSVCHDLQIDISKEKKKEIVEKVNNLRSTPIEEYYVTWVSNVQSEGMEIHGGTCLYDWEEAKSLADPSFLELIEEHRGEIYY